MSFCFLSHATIFNKLHNNTFLCNLCSYHLTNETNTTVKDNSLLFKIDSKTGEIKVASLLKGYSGIYYITVMATSKLQTSRPAKRIVIKILDVNDYHPKFIKPKVDGSMAYVLEVCWSV